MCNRGKPKFTHPKATPRADRDQSTRRGFPAGGLSRFDVDHSPQEVTQLYAVVRTECRERLGSETQRPLEVAREQGAGGGGQVFLAPPVAAVGPALDQAAGLEPVDDPRHVRALR